MEGIPSLKGILQRNDYMGKVDLQGAYLKFHWKGKNYRFQSLPFGLAAAPRVFTKILCPLAAKMRLGIRVIFYLDNILVLSQSKELLKSHMESLGFKLNLKKCAWAPSQVIDFLGFLIDSTTMKLFLPEEKIDKILKECWHLLNKTVVLS